MSKKIEVDIETLITMYKDGKTMAELAVVFGVSAAFICKKLKASGVETRTVGNFRPILDMNDIKEKYSTGMSIKAIADELGISASFLYKHMKEYEISFRNRGETVKKFNLTREDFEDLYTNQKNSLSKIAKMCGLSMPVIKKWRDNWEFERIDSTYLIKKHYGTHEIDVENLIRLWNDNKSSHEIGLSLGISDVTVLSILRSNGIDTSLKLSKPSKIETHMIELFNSLGCNLVSTRKILNGLELDGYDEEHKFAIEMCGLYWHSELMKPNKNYHKLKYDECKKQGIRLFTIFEDEWINSSEKITQFILSNIGKYNIKIGARECEIIKVEKEIAKSFLDIYHIQGSPQNIESAVGILYNGELVSIMSFAKHHRGNDIMVLNRYCTKSGVLVVGGASKMISHCGYNEFITWSDNRFSNGSLYETLGFIKDAEYDADYCWTNFSRRMSKQSRQKSVTKQPKEITEREWNEQQGLSRLWDCGKVRWRYKK